MTRQTREIQYTVQVEEQETLGAVRLGLTTSHLWRHDPRHLVFLLSRYKFVSKMLAGTASALEIGCGDGFGSCLVHQEVPRVVGVDFDPVFVEHARAERAAAGLTFEQMDYTLGHIPGSFDAVYALDVVEHIPAAKEELFMRHLLASLAPTGACIIGTPSLESQPHASPASRAGHINCKSGPHLREWLRGFFTNVFLFGMNDEVLHTGFHPMCHYLFALCTGPRHG